MEDLELDHPGVPCVCPFVRVVPGPYETGYAIIVHEGESPVIVVSQGCFYVR